LAPLLKLAVPLVLAGMVQSSSFFFETLFLAHLGQTYIAAGALASWLFATLVVILFGILSAINVLVSHSFGADEYDKIADMARDGIYFAVLFGLFSFLLLWYAPHIFVHLGQHPDVIILATRYLHPLAWGIIPNLIMVALMEVLVGIGQSNVIMLFSSLSVALNVLFSYLLIFGKFHFPKLDIAGAGWGTTIGLSVSCTLLIFYIAYHKKFRVYFSKIFHFSGPLYFIELIKVGLPMGLMYLGEVGFFLVLTLSMGALNPQLMAANQIAMQYMTAFMGIAFSIAQAITVRMGHLLGGKNYADAKVVAYLGTSLCAGIMLLAACAYLFAPTFLINLDLGGDNMSLLQITVRIFVPVAFFQVFEAMRITLFGALRALKDTRFTLLISLLGFWVIALPIGHLLVRTVWFSATGLWWGMVIGVAISMLLSCYRFFIKMKQYRQFY
jgi:MATE family multidrug resistance protein